MPCSWLEELEAEVGSFGPSGSAALLACLPRHGQVSSDRGVPCEHERGRRRSETADSGPQSGSTKTPSSCGAASPSPSVSGDRLGFLCRVLCSEGPEAASPPTILGLILRSLPHTLGESFLFLAADLPSHSFDSQPSPTCGGIARGKPCALLPLPLVTRPSHELARSKYARSVKGVVA